MDLLCEIKRDLYSNKLVFPNSVLAFTEMVPRLLWSPLDSLFYLDRIRRCLNRTIHNFLVTSGRVSYRHIELEGFLPDLFRTDLVHLSDICLDVFNMGLQSLIESATVLGVSQPAGSLLAPTVERSHPG